MWNTPARRRTQAGTKLGLHLEPAKSLNVSNPQLPVLLLSLKMILFHLSTKEPNQTLQVTCTIPGTELSLSVNPLAWQWSFWWIRMKIKISEAHSITVMMWFYKKWCPTTWDSEGRWHHPLWGTSTTSEGMNWGGVGEGAVSFHPGLLEDVTAERMKLAGDPVGWRGNGVLHLENIEYEHLRGCKSVEIRWMWEKGFQLK